MDLIIFDFGAVLYDIDFTKTREAMHALAGYNGVPIHFGVDKQDDIFLAADRGEVTNEEFRAAMRTRWGFTCTDAELDAAWCALLKEPFPYAVDVVRKARRTAPVVLLSNISDLHLMHVLPQCRTLLPLFDGLFLSCQTGLRKPDPEAFLHPCDIMNADPERTMLFDDSGANCEAAASVGILVRRVTDPYALPDMIP